MTKVIIEWQNQFGGWYRFQEQHHEPSAYRTAKQRAKRKCDENTLRLFDSNRSNLAPRAL